MVRVPKVTNDSRQRHFARTATAGDYDYITKARTWSVILPAGLAGGAGLDDLSIGIGGSYGWTTVTGVELGIAIAMVWQQAEYLTAQQKAYVGQALPEGVSDTIETRMQPSIVIGLYIVPTF